MNQPILQDNFGDGKKFLKLIKEKYSTQEKPQIKVLGCGLCSYDCKNCGIGKY
jgi:hypothetical protein